MGAGSGLLANPDAISGNKLYIWLFGPPDDLVRESVRRKLTLLFPASSMSKELTYAIIRRV
jgi:hypothetical protein